MKLSYYLLIAITNYIIDRKSYLISFKTITDVEFKENSNKILVLMLYEIAHSNSYILTHI